MSDSAKTQRKASDTAAKPVYTLEDAAKHNKPDDMWLVIHGKIYDVTKFREDHPGGPEILADNAGTDCTEAFEEVFHSDAARLTMKQYEIGSLAGYVDDGKVYRKSKGKQDNGNTMLYAIPIVIIVVALVYKFFLAR